MCSMTNRSSDKPKGSTKKSTPKRRLAAARARDLELINAAADRLNAEAAEAMEYQAPIE